MLFRASQSVPLDLQLVVGLGNIGRQYHNTRHNVGFEVVDLLAREVQTTFRIGKFKGEEATIHLRGQRLLLLKPHTLMNLSGEAVVAAARYYKLPPARILVICDDVHLPLGRLRLRAKGSDGGHNGLWSIINRLGSQEFPRLRLGVDETPPEMAMADYVLGHFASAERAVINEAYARAARAVETWATEGIEAAMNRWNAGAP